MVAESSLLTQALFQHIKPDKDARGPTKRRTGNLRRCPANVHKRQRMNIVQFNGNKWAGNQISSCIVESGGHTIFFLAHPQPNQPQVIKSSRPKLINVTASDRLETGSPSRHSSHGADFWMALRLPISTHQSLLDGIARIGSRDSSKAGDTLQPNTDLF